MKHSLRHAAALALLLLASCGLIIKQSTTRAEAAADRAERSATMAEQSADQASKSSARALIAADQAEEATRRANDAVSRLESPSIVHGELLMKQTEGSPLRWCLMGPPGIQASPMGSVSVDWHAPRSRFWVGEIFDTQGECHESLRDARRFYLRGRRTWRARHLHDGGKVFQRAFSSDWILRHRIGDSWVDESSGTTNKRDAERLLARKVYEDSRYVPFTPFCAACANAGDDDEE